MTCEIQSVPIYHEQFGER